MNYDQILTNAFKNADYKIIHKNYGYEASIRFICAVRCHHFSFDKKKELIENLKNIPTDVLNAQLAKGLNGEEILKQYN